MLQPPFVGSLLRRVHPSNMNLCKLYPKLSVPVLPFPLARVAWALYGLAGQYLSLEGGGLYPTPHTQLSIVKFGLRAPSFTTISPLALKSLE
jgi:hypothetical protein